MAALCGRSVRALELAAGLFGAVALAVGIGLASDEGVLLRHHWRKGDTALYDYGVSARARVEEEGVTEAQEAEITFQTTCRVEFLEALPDGGQEVRAEFLPGAMRVKTEGGEQAMAGGGFVVRCGFSPLGELVKYEVVDGEPPKLYFPGMHLALGPEDAFLLAGVAVFPESAVKKEEKWEGIARKPRGAGGEVQEEPYGSRLLGEEEFQGRRCVKIRTARSSELEGSYSAPGVPTVKVKGTITGRDVWRFDRERGIIMSIEGTHHLAVTTRAESGGKALGTATTSAGITTRSRMVEFRGRKLSEK